MKSYIIYLITLAFSLSAYAQKETDVLLYVNDEPITVAEFKQVYLKNIDILEEESKIDPAEYLDLFVPYKLKVQEAYKLGLDEKTAYKKELNGYKKQLAKTFLTDLDLTDKIVREAYDRMVNEVSAKHILIKVPLTAPAKDTLVAYNKIMEARNKVVAGEDFEKIAKAYSQDPSVKKNGGDLGWFKAFRMVYSFENAAYNTEIGEVSMPFRSNFGYHILVTTGKRKGDGAVKAAHIMIIQDQEDKTVNPKERIDKIYELLEKGEDFASLAKTYSDDNRTASKGGLIKQFERGQLRSTKFEDIAFSLTTEGEYSKPFKTNFGWHICKLIERLPVGSFEEEKGAIEKKLKKDKRAKAISDVLVNKLKGKYDKEDISDIVAVMKNKEIGDFKNRHWKFNDTLNNGGKPAFTLRDSTYVVKDLALFLEDHYDPTRYPDKEIFFENVTRKYVDLKMLEYHEGHLEELDPKFKTVLREYKEGLLIFDLMDQQIWNKAKTDTVGLERFYNANKSKYIATPEAVATVYTSQNKGTLVDFRSSLLSSATNTQDAMPEDLLKTAKNLVIKETGSYAPEYTPVKGVSDVLAYNNGYVLYDVSEIRPERIKTLKEAKGQVVSEYQKQLESDWIEGLQSNASVKVKKRVLKKLKKQLK